jgi:lysophospholipase L1-like esterase
MKRMRFWPRLSMTAFLLPGVLLLPLSGLRADDNSAVKPVAKKDKRWQQLHASFVKRAERGAVDVLFLGDSITEAWSGSGKEMWQQRFKPLKAANFGISGDRTEHVLWRLQKGKELHGIQPRAVVLMIGTNNTGSNTAEQIADGITAIVEELRRQLPQAQILLLGVFPRSAKATDPVRAKIKEINQRIEKLDDDKHVHYLDIGDKFLAADASLTKDIMPDYLHLSPRGYQIWADAIQPKLEEMLKR